MQALPYVLPLHPHTGSYWKVQRQLILGFSLQLSFLHCVNVRSKIVATVKVEIVIFITINFNLSVNQNYLSLQQISRRASVEMTPNLRHYTLFKVPHQPSSNQCMSFFVWMIDL